MCSRIDIEYNEKSAWSKKRWESMLYEYLVTGFSHEVQMHSPADVKCTDEKETATTTVKQIDLSLYYINALKGTQYRPAAAGQSAVKQAYVHGKTAAVYVAVKLPRYKHTAAYGPVKLTPAVQCDHGKTSDNLAVIRNSATTTPRPPYSDAAAFSRRYNASQNVRHLSPRHLTPDNNHRDMDWG